MLTAQTPPGSVAQTDLYEFYFYVAIAVAIAFVLMIVQRFLRARADSKLRGLHVNGTLDFDRMKRSGLLSEEELKVVRRRMAENMKKQLEGDSGKRGPGRSAEQILAELDQRLETEGLEALREAGAGEQVEARPDRQPIDLLKPPPKPPAERLSALEEERLAQLARQGDLGRTGSDLLPGEEISRQLSPEDPDEEEPPPAAEPPERKAGADASSRVNIDELLKQGIISRDEYERMKEYYARKGG